MISASHLAAVPNAALLVREYVDALLDDSRSPGDADRAISQALEKGADPMWILLHLIPAALHEIGDRWQAGEISVGDEHLATGIVQGTMRDVARRLTRSSRLDRAIVVAAVGGELHDNGARLLSDMLDAHGWDAFFAGAATPVADLVRLIEERRPAAVALSITLPRYMPALEAAVRALKSQVSDAPFVVVGGQGCAGQSDLAERLGADAHARTIDEALLLLSIGKSGGDDQIRTGA
ncbi:MAG TPA: cobalamin-dependent protein [Candidatus Limnocylindrales bacterium]|nr:cobalamin-dependent protein [Candidatus Limnocylindrales bacterium]